MSPTPFDASYTKAILAVPFCLTISAMRSTDPSLEVRLRPGCGSAHVSLNGKERDQVSTSEAPMK
jgi:hypothetical protein